MTIILTPDQNLFAKADGNDRESSQKFPRVLFDLITQKFGLNGQGKLLDIGCGIGSLTIPLSRYFEEAIGIDPDSLILQNAQRQAQVVGTNNISWVRETGQNISPTAGKFRLITISKTWEWMESELFIRRIYNLLADDGGLAIIKRYESFAPSSNFWKRATNSIIKRWLGEQKYVGQANKNQYSPIEVSYAEILAKSAFKHQATYEIKYIKTWTMDSYIDHVHNTVFNLSTFSPESCDRLITNLQTSLCKFEPSGKFTEILPIQVIAAWKSKPTMMRN